MHASPLFIIAFGRSIGSASSRFTSSSRTAADLPPSSRLKRLRFSPQAVAIFLPATEEPVKDTLSIPGCLTRCSPTSRPAGTIESTPFGSPASSNISASLNASKGSQGRA